MQQLATFMLGIEGPPYVTLISIIQLIHTSNILLDDVISTVKTLNCGNKMVTPVLDLVLGKLLVKIKIHPWLQAKKDIVQQCMFRIRKQNIARRHYINILQSCTIFFVISNLYDIWQKSCPWHYLF